MAGDQALFLDLPDKIQHLLGPAHGKGGDHHVAAPVKGRLYFTRQSRNIVRALLSVEPVAVGGFDHQIVRLLHLLGVLEDGLIRIAHVTAEGDLSVLTVLRKPDLDGGGTEKMAHIGKADGHTVVHLHRRIVGAGAHTAHQPGHIVQIIQRLDLRPAVSYGFAAFPLRLGHLYVCAVAEHDITERAGGRACVDRAAKAVFVQQGEIARMVDMGVGQQDKVYLGWVHRQLLIFKNILTLLHAAVHKTLFVARFDQRAASRDLMGRA